MQEQLSQTGLGKKKVSMVSAYPPMSSRISAENIMTRVSCIKTPPDMEKPLRSFKRETFCNAVKTPNLEESLHMKQASR